MPAAMLMSMGASAGRRPWNTLALLLVAVLVAYALAAGHRWRRDDERFDDAALDTAVLPGVLVRVNPRCHVANADGGFNILHAPGMWAAPGAAAADRCVITDPLHPILVANGGRCEPAMLNDLPGAPDNPPAVVTARVTDEPPFFQKVCELTFSAAATPQDLEALDGAIGERVATMSKLYKSTSAELAELRDAAWDDARKSELQSLKLQLGVQAEAHSTALNAENAAYAAALRRHAEARRMRLFRAMLRKREEAARKRAERLRQMADRQRQVADQQQAQQQAQQSMAAEVTLYASPGFRNAVATLRVKGNGADSLRKPVKVGSLRFAGSPATLVLSKGRNSKRTYSASVQDLRANGGWVLSGSLRLARKATKERFVDGEADAQKQQLWGAVKASWLPGCLVPAQGGGLYRVQTPGWRRPPSSSPLGLVDPTIKTTPCAVLDVASIQPAGCASVFPGARAEADATGRGCLVHLPAHSHRAAELAAWDAAMQERYVRHHHAFAAVERDRGAELAGRQRRASAYDADRAAYQQQMARASERNAAQVMGIRQRTDALVQEAARWEQGIL